MTVIKNVLAALIDSHKRLSDSTALAEDSNRAALLFAGGKLTEAEYTEITAQLADAGTTT